MPDVPTGTPHLKVPLKINGDHFETVEEDTPEEITQCVYAILVYRQPQRDERPDFGQSDQAFRLNGADIAEISATIVRDEPRAQAMIENETIPLLGMIDLVDIRMENE